MLFASTLLSAALLMLASVTALPQHEEGGLMGRQSSCPSGSFRANTTACAPCPAGNTCSGGRNRPDPCDTGLYQPNTGSTSCLRTPPGFFTNRRGSAMPTPCPAGSYQPYSRQAFCYGAPRGRFQQQTGKSFVCATCCGWATTMNNNNVNPVKCGGAAPFAWPNSGDGCISRPTSCTPAATCAQAANGTCHSNFSFTAGQTIRG
ncbi:hypothetical protein R3P38DRAFT_3262488 [Favolaschia claudopus]|uniref:Tyrosine-protein kinase ephrin type A/B receptor-like domain-containing protein n=1 Tax=Favolaschia claudopus TaxID=2862362 RepID=A0AAW0CGJ7_9AGAR